MAGMMRRQDEHAEIMERIRQAMRHHLARWAATPTTERVGREEEGEREGRHADSTDQG